MKLFTRFDGTGLELGMTSIRVYTCDYCVGCRQIRSIVLSTADTPWQMCQTCHDYDADDADNLSADEARLIADWETGIERGEQWALDCHDYEGVWP